MPIDSSNPSKSPATLIHELESIVERIDLEKIFPKAQPLQLELGSGDGSFLAKLQQPLRAGELRWNGMTIRFDTKQVGGMPISAGKPLGYVFSRNGREIGGVDLGGGFTPPAFFLPMLLEVGVYYGVRDNGALVAIAGTHVISITHGVGTIGNVHTRPDYRRRGLAGALTRAVSRELRWMGASTVVLNVVAENVVARRVYTRIGFEEYCGYLDGNASR